MEIPPGRTDLCTIFPRTTTLPKTLQPAVLGRIFLTQTSAFLSIVALIRILTSRLEPPQLHPTTAVSTPGLPILKLLITIISIGHLAHFVVELLEDCPISRRTIFVMVAQV
jgi:hypothetical protein